jgi:VanZ family protein
VAAGKFGVILIEVVPAGLRRRLASSGMSRRVAVIGLVAYLAVLASLTLGSSPGALFVSIARAVQSGEGPDWVTVSDVERTLNVLVFVPAGLLLCAALPGVGRLLVWLMCVAMSVAVEAVQVFLPDRQPTPVDVVMNALGAAIGVLLHAALTWWTARRQLVRQQ